MLPYHVSSEGTIYQEFYYADIAIYKSAIDDDAITEEEYKEIKALVAESLRIPSHTFLSWYLDDDNRSINLIINDEDSSSCYYEQKVRFERGYASSYYDPGCPDELDGYYDDTRDLLKDKLHLPDGWEFDIYDEHCDTPDTLWNKINDEDEAAYDRYCDSVCDEYLGK